MKIVVTWDKTDVEANRRVRDTSGCKALIIQSDAQAMSWSIVRLADGFFYQPMSIETLVARLNSGCYTPEEVHK